MRQVIIICQMVGMKRVLQWSSHMAAIALGLRFLPNAYQWIEQNVRNRCTFHLSGISIFTSFHTIDHASGERKMYGNYIREYKIEFLLYF